MGEVHRLLTEQGKEQALRGDLNRSVVEAASSYLADEMAGLSIVYSGWCHAALPHKRLADDAIWANGAKPRARTCTRTNAIVDRSC